MLSKQQKKRKTTTNINKTNFKNFILFLKIEQKKVLRLYIYICFSIPESSNNVPFNTLAR